MALRSFAGGGNGFWLAAFFVNTLRYLEQAGCADFHSSA